MPYFEPKTAQPPVAASISQGLTLSLSAFEADGWKYDGGFVNLIPNGTWYVGVDLYTKQVVTLPRDLHRGYVRLAKVTTDSTSITAIKYYQPTLPPSRVPRSMSRILRGETLNVVIMGSSLTSSGGQSTNWPGMVFGGGKVTDYRLPGSLATSYTGVGGTPNSYQLAQTGFFGSHGDAQFADGGMMEHDQPRRGRSHLFNGIDLVVLGCLANGGDNRLELIEPIVRNLRKRNVEVILVTDNPQGPTLDPSLIDSRALHTDGWKVQEVAERYGCELADTSSYVAEQYIRKNGTGVYSDAIHMASGEAGGVANQLVANGHEAWARAVRSLFHVHTPVITNPTELFPWGTFDGAAPATDHIGAEAAAMTVTFANGKMTAAHSSGAIAGGAGRVFNWTGVGNRPPAPNLGATYEVEYVVTAVQGTHQVGVLYGGTWASGTSAVQVTAPGTYKAQVVVNASGSTYSHMFWAQGTGQSNTSITFESISLKKIADSAASLASGRSVTDQLLPPPRTVEYASTIPGDAFVILPKYEQAFRLGNPAKGTLGASPLGSGSFSRRMASSSMVGASEDMLTLSAGQTVRISGTNSLGMAFIRHTTIGDPETVLEVMTNDTARKTITLGAVTQSNGESIHWFYTFPEWKTFLGGNGGMQGHRGLRVNVVSGILKLVALVVFTPEQDYVSPEELNFRGSWTRRTTRGVTGYTSDTVGDMVSYRTPRYGRRFQWVMAGHPNSKTVNMWGDGPEISGVNLVGTSHVKLHSPPSLHAPEGLHRLQVATAAAGDDTNGYSVQVAGGVVVYDR